MVETVSTIDARHHLGGSCQGLSGSGTVGFLAVHRCDGRHFFVLCRICLVCEPRLTLGCDKSSPSCFIRCAQYTVTVGGVQDFHHFVRLLIIARIVSDASFTSNCRLNVDLHSRRLSKIGSTCGPLELFFSSQHSPMTHRQDNVASLIEICSPRV